MPGPVIPSPFILPQKQQRREEPDFLKQLLMGLVGGAAQEAVSYGLREAFQPSPETLLAETEATNPTMRAQRGTEQAAFADLMQNHLPFLIERVPGIQQVFSGNTDPATAARTLKAAEMMAPTLLAEAGRLQRRAQGEQMFGQMLQNIDAQISQLNAGGTPADDPMFEVLQFRRENIGLQRQLFEMQENPQIDATMATNLKEQLATSTSDLFDAFNIRVTRMMMDPNTNIQSIRELAGGNTELANEAAAALAQLGFASLLQYDLTRGDTYDDMMTQAAVGWLAQNPIEGASVQDVKTWLQGGRVRPELSEFFQGLEAQRKLANDLAMLNYNTQAMDANPALQVSANLIQMELQKGTPEGERAAIEEYNFNYIPTLRRTPGLDRGFLDAYVTPLPLELDDEGSNFLRNVFGGTGAVGGAIVGFMGGSSIPTRMGKAAAGAVAGMIGGGAVGRGVQDAFGFQFGADPTLTPAAGPAVDLAINTIVESGGSTQSAIQQLQADIATLSSSTDAADVEIVRQLRAALQLLQNRSR